MAHALETVDKSKILIDHPLLTTTVGDTPTGLNEREQRVNIR